MRATVLSGLVKTADMSLRGGAAYGVILEIERNAKYSAGQNVLDFLHCLSFFSPLVDVSLGYLRSRNLVTHPSAAERAAHLITDWSLNRLEELEFLRCRVSKLG